APGSSVEQKALPLLALRKKDRVLALPALPASRLEPAVLATDQS
ncbi:unnamed protein product, partial [marine sediment metagenome]